MKRAQGITKDGIIITGIVVDEYHDRIDIHPDGDKGSWDDAWSFPVEDVTIISNQNDEEKEKT